MASSRGQIIPKGYGYLVRIYIGRDATGKRNYQNQKVSNSKKHCTISPQIPSLKVRGRLHFPS